MKYGEIWLVNFDGSVGHEFQKTRPALIIQSNEQLKITTVVTIIPLTSNTSNKDKDDILIAKNSQNNLYLDSILKLYYIQSFDRSRFLHKIGILSDAEMSQVSSYLKKHFGIVEN